MMAPALVVLGLLSLVPFFTMIVMSLSDVKTMGKIRLEFAGVDNWVAILSDVAIWESWARTVIQFVAIVALEMLLGFAFAIVLHNLIRARSMVLSIVLLPMFIAPVMVGLLGRFMLDPTIGLYAQAVQALGFPADFFSSPATAMPTVILIDVWEWTPLVALIMLAGLTSVPISTLEAAAVDGAGYFQTLFRVTVPQMKPVMLVALLVRSMDAIRFYDIITVTTNGGPADSTKTVPIKLYELAFRFNDGMGKAAAVGLMMLAVSIFLAKRFVAGFSNRDATTELEGERT